MLEFLLPYEKGLFFFINGNYSYFMDCFMWLFSGSIIWVPLIVFLVFSFSHKKKWIEIVPFFIFLGLVFLLCDQFSAHLIKPIFERPRPTHYPEIMQQVRILHGYTGGRYGFISSHAANAFGFATFTALILHNKIYSFTIIFWAFIMIYSRVYLGVHFISDIFFGSIAGIIIGAIVFIFYKNLSIRISNSLSTPILVNYTTTTIKVISFTIISYIFLFSIFSKYIIHILGFVKLW